MKKNTTLILILVNTIFFAQVQTSRWTIQGKNLTDDCGQNIILKGVNHGNIWATNWGLNEMPQIALTGANSVRICLEQNITNYDNNGNPFSIPVVASNIEPIIQSCLANNMIPILELHDYTQFNATVTAVQSLPLATAFWTRSDILALLKKYQNYLILNIANEPEHWDTTQIQYYNANKTALLALRNAGLNLPIMIDGYGWGQDINFFVNYASTLQNDDPLHKMIFSIHAYWENTTDAIILARVQALNALNVPIVFGEISKSLASANTTINYQYLMQLCTTYNIGFHGWWWGFTNPTSNNVLSMSPTGMFAGLTGFGNIMAVIDPNSIQNTSVRPIKLVTGACGVLANEVVELTNEFKFYPNPVSDILTFENLNNNSIISVYNFVGQELVTQKSSNFITEVNLSNMSKGFYFLKIKSNDEEKVIRILKK